MQANTTYILTVNAGSSSLKLALFAGQGTERLLEAAVENIGQPTARLIAGDNDRPVSVEDHARAANLLEEWLMAHIEPDDIVAIGHRIVHGGPEYYATQPATAETLAGLRQLVAFDPEHLPTELALVEHFQRTLPHAHHVLCFDTTFHHHLPTRARLLPLPRRFEAAGIRRYGFHGLSYAFIVEELRRVEGDTAANGKVIIAHLGSGASLAALAHGTSVDTTMGLTPASGIPMSTRSGDLDPGLALYLAKTQGYDAERFNHMANFESGLLGISETTADMKRLLQIEHEDARAKDAVDVFCYHARKQIGALAAALGGLHTLVFTGGMGEAAPKIRSRICEGLEFLGIVLDNQRNENGERLISADGSPVGVHVIRTDEAATIASETAKLIQKQETP